MAALSLTTSDSQLRNGSRLLALQGILCHTRQSHFTECVLLFQTPFFVGASPSLALRLGTGAVPSPLNFHSDSRSTPHATNTSQSLVQTRDNAQPKPFGQLVFAPERGLQASIGLP